MNGQISEHEPQHQPASPPTSEDAPLQNHDLIPVRRKDTLLDRFFLQKRRWRLWAGLLLVLLGGAAGFYSWRSSLNRLPVGIVYGNGRLEADEIAIATKFAGRIANLYVDEGDIVRGGQVVAQMDVQDLTASLKKAKAQVLQAQHAIEEATSNVAQQQAQVILARQELDRASVLVAKGTISRELFDQRQQQMDSADAALAAAKFRAEIARHALEASTHDVELYQVNIADNSLAAPRDGRIQYRLANTGEVLPAGGKVFAMLDTSYVYMDVYLPTKDAGRVKIGSDSRIVLDAYPDRPIPAKVSFIATQAQFTPKAVETQTERDKLMFRIRVRIDPALLQEHAEEVRSGLPGLGYIRVDQDTPWPDRLK